MMRDQKYHKEREIIDFFSKNGEKTKEEIVKELSFDPSNYLSDLVYFGYLAKTKENTYTKTKKDYCKETREKEKRETKDYSIVLNKIFAGSFFSGSFLSDNLGHELINFIKDQNGNRYVYLNPWGERGEEASKKTEFVFHIIESTLGDYELVAVSKIDKNATDLVYDKNEDRKKEIEGSPWFGKHTFYEIFSCGSQPDKAHVYTYKASAFYKPKGNLKIVFNTNKDSADFRKIDSNLIEIDLMCNPQHNLAYADSTGKKTYDSKPNEQKDTDVLRRLIQSEDLVNANDENIDLDNTDDELCYSAICDRTKLEDSTSNQIAYFLYRDKTLLRVFLTSFLSIKDIEANESFEIVREKEDNIDLLIKSDKHVIVIENKIDSGINGVSKDKDGNFIKNKNGKFDSQLSKYWKYIEEKYPNIGKKHKRFFVLAPDYNPITADKLNKDYESGSNYRLVRYANLYKKLAACHYCPLGLESKDNLGEFMYKQFLKGLEYISLPKAQQYQKAAYIRFKQRIQELDAEKQKVK